jgi:hypothetical protein
LEPEAGGGELEDEERAVGIVPEGGEWGVLFQVAGAELARGAFDEVLGAVLGLDAFVDVVVTGEDELDVVLLEERFEQRAEVGG